MRLHHDLNVAVEAGEEAHQALDGIFPEATLEHPRHLRLGDAHEFPGRGLGELAFVGDPVDFRNDLSFQEMSVSIRQAEIGKDVAASHLHFDLAYHHFLSSLKRWACSCSASFSRRFTRSMSPCGVLMPRFDFFLKACRT